MRKLFALAILTLAVMALPSYASNCSSNPYTLTNGATADANQVMSNFNNLLNCANSNLAHNGANSDITSLSGVTTPLSVGQGGTSAATASGARTALGAAASGANSDITSLSGVTTPLSVGQGGTSAATASGARTALGAAASGANSDITSLTGLTTPLSVAQGGTGATTAAGARRNPGIPLVVVAEAYQI